MGSIKLHTKIKQKRSNLKLRKLLVFMLPLLVLLPFMQNIVQADNYVWTQTNWSGGMASGTVNGTVTTYDSITNLNTLTPGEASLSTRSNWCANASCDLDWKYRSRITFDNTSATLGVTSEDLINFPVLIKLNSSRIDYLNTQDAGQDIRFTDSDGTELPYEIENWNESGDSSIWVKVPLIDADSSTDHIFIYYGNPSAVDDQSPTDVWTQNYTAVWNLNDASQTVLDSTSNNFDGTLGGSAGVSTDDPTIQLTQDCKSGQCYSFDGGDFINTTFTSAIGTSPSTVTAWFKAPNSNQASMVWSKRLTSTPFTQYSLMIASACNGTTGQFLVAVDLPAKCSVHSADVADTTWHHVVFARTTSGMTVYLDGVLVLNVNSGTSNLSNTNAFRIGDGNGTFRFNGQIDHVTLSSVSRTAGWAVANYKSDNDQFNTYDSVEGLFETTGIVVSNIFDTGVPSNWQDLTYVEGGTGNVELKVRTSNSSTMSGADDFGDCNPISSGSSLLSSSCVTTSHRYIQYQVALSVTDISLSPILLEVSIEHSDFDETPPPTNATDLAITGYNDFDDWINIEPTLTWTVGQDNIGGAEILGYCIALEEADQGTTSNLDPEITAGVFNGKDDGVTRTDCPYIATGDSLNLQSIPDLNLVIGKQYNFSIKAIDKSGNIWTGVSGDYQDLLNFKYDDSPPTAPGFISMPSNFISTKDVTITWPFGGASGTVTDTGSGVAGLQYKIGESGTWFGDLHLGSEDVLDVLTNDGSYTTSAEYDYSELTEGINFIYFRTIDLAGNISIAEVNGVLKINTIAPSEVRNLVAIPTTNTTNAYSFDWDAPLSYTGVVSNITYCYTINILPSIGTCNFTSAGATVLNTDAYATQPGENIIYVVARDEANNINYGTYISTTFSYSGSAPGIPGSIDIADISVKATSSWKLALSWDAPVNVGAGISKYTVHRSTSNLSCSSDFNSFTKVADVNSTAFIDSGLTQQSYYYCVKACDSANNCSAPSSTVTDIPEGKYTEPAVLTSGPIVSATTTRKAVINWSTDRNSDSRIQFGLSSGSYFLEEVSISSQTTAHTITLNNLDPGTTYYFRARWTDEDGNLGTSTEMTFVTDPAPELKNAVAERISVDSTIIRFTTSGAVQAKLFYGPNGIFNSLSEINVSSLESTYTIQLTGLTDDTQYSYRINLVDLDEYEYTGDINLFRTLPRPRVSDLSIEEIRSSAQPTVRVSWSSNTEISSIVTYYPSSNRELATDEIEITPKTVHSLEVTGLLAATPYTLIVRGIDRLGNEAISTEYFFTTSTDTRPPTITNLRLETTLGISTGENNAQIIVTWETDEPADSQVEFGEGITSNFNQATSIDRNLKRNHTMIISNVSAAQVYSLRVVSRDLNQNISLSAENVVITPKYPESALEVVIRSLTGIFNFL